MRKALAVLAAMFCITSIEASAQRYVLRERLPQMHVTAQAPAKPAVKCGTLVPRKYGPAVDSKIGRTLGSAASSAAAISLCQAEGANSGPGICQWDSMDRVARYAPGSTYIADYPDSYLSAGYCS